MITLTVSSRIAIRGLPPGPLEDEIRRAFTHANPDWAKAQRYGIRGKIPKWIVDATRSKEDLSVPRGGFDTLTEILERSGSAFRVVDERTMGEPCEMPAHRLELYDYQRRLLEEALVAEGELQGVCLWRSPQGSGKTTAALALAAKVGYRTLVIVSTSNLLDQWVRRVRAELGIEAGVIGGGKLRVDSPIVIGMQQSLRTLAPKVRHLFGTLIADEVQLFAATTFTSIIDEFPARLRIGVSGDERRADQKEFLIYGRFGDVRAQVSHEEIVARGFVHEVEVRVVPTTFRAQWWLDLANPHDGESSTEKARRVAQARMLLRDQLLAQLAEDPERLALIAEIMREAVAEAGQVLVLSGRREQCHRIDALAVAQGLASGLLIGGADYREQFAATLRGIVERRLQVAVGTYQAIGVGFDVPQVAAGICASPVANAVGGDKQWRQYRGRFARTADGKTSAVIYYLWDREVFGSQPLRYLRKWNRVVTVKSGAGYVPAEEWIKHHANAGKHGHEGAGTDVDFDERETAGGDKYDAFSEFRGGSDAADQAVPNPRASGGAGVVANAPRYRLRSDVQRLRAGGK